MTVSQPEPCPVAGAAPEWRAAEEAYRELQATWDTFVLALAQALPQIMADQTWRQWLDDGEVRQVRMILGEWVVGGDPAPESQTQVAVELARLGPRLARVLPPELRASYIRAGELSAFLIEQVGRAQGSVPPAAALAARCACGVAVPAGSRCRRCGRSVCVVHSLQDPSRDDGRRLCRRCAAHR